MISKFKKRPLVIEAIQFTGENASEIVEWANGKVIIPKDFHNFINNYLQIITLEGVMVASINDYIIKGIKNEFYSCKPDIFFESYDKV